MDHEISSIESNTKWYDVARACDYLSVSKTTLYRYMKDGRLPFYHLADTTSRRVKKNDLDALLVLVDPADVDDEDE
ncbi:helix-turn-helix domain-containing protein [Chloroflexi bacterium TSY]|nr:helix-turn-helix domain-containing protein [Chloroflexi bacterium TSY]